MTDRTIVFPDQKPDISDQELRAIREIAYRTRAFYEAFVDAGFNDEEAHKLAYEMFRIHQSGGEQIKTMEAQLKLQIEAQRAAQMGGPAIVR